MTRRARATKVRLLVYSMKEVGCCKCPEYDPACLDYHHVNPADKEFGMGSRLTSRGPLSLVLESSKCVVVCSNCHRKHHYRRGSMNFDLPTIAEMDMRFQCAIIAGALDRSTASSFLSMLRGLRV